MSEVKFACLHCGQKLCCDRVLAGSRITCPACQRSLVVPWAAASVSAEKPAPSTQRAANATADASSAAAAEGALPEVSIPPISIPALSPPTPATASLRREKLHLAGHREYHAAFSKLATAAFALALLGLVVGPLVGPLGLLPAIICGHLAKWQMRQNRSLRGQGLATAGLAIAYTSALLISVLLARTFLGKL